MTLAETVKSLVRKPLVYLATTAILAGCYTQPMSRNDTPSDTNMRQVQEINYNNDNRSFVGTPLTPINSGNDLEFLMKSEDEETGKSFYITVHEDADFSNQKNLDLVKNWIEESKNEPDVEFKVVGEYIPDNVKTFLEEGTLDPYVIIKTTNDSINGPYEELVWTDKKDSPVYTENNIDIIVNYVYYPGHHIWLTHYPYGFNPHWDIDGDGVPNKWDPDPYNFGPWVDLNHNHIWDWYDPFCGGIYWDYWHNHHHHHPEFIIVWQNYYGDEFNHHKKFKERDREREHIRNDFGGRNPNDSNPRGNDIIKERKPNNERDDIIKRKGNDKKPGDTTLPPKKERDKTIDDKVIDDRINIKDLDKERNQNKNTDSERDKNPIYKKSEDKKDKEREIYNTPPIKRDDTIQKQREEERSKYNKEVERRNNTREVERKTYEKQKDVKTYTPPTNTYTPPKKEERQYTPPKQNTNPPRQTVNPPPRNNTNNDSNRQKSDTRNNTNNNQQKSRERK